MDYSIKFVTSWLKDASTHMTDILTVCGMSGIGKTSLAKYVYMLHCHEFQTSSYIEDISRRCDEKFRLPDLQKQLYDDISKTSSIKVHDISIYTSKIENVVSRKKVFLVLDDINNLDQLDALLGRKGFHPGSKIIITTKDSWLTESCALFKTNVKPKHVKHMLQGLYETASQNLLCFHAFICQDPKTGYEKVVEDLVKYCEGHPLALEVLGKSLYDRDVGYWEECMKGLRKESGSHINNVLRVSFDSLPSKNDKELFKHIACFFVGMDRDVSETILKACDINTRLGITNLIDKCLLHIGRKNKLMMHRLLQEMGRFIVCQESPNKPWKRSRLWCHEDSFKVLKQKKGKGNLLGLALDLRMLEKEKMCVPFELKTDALSKMDNLMLLQLNYVQMNGSYENFPEELRWLCMHGFLLKSIPLDLPMDNLVALDMSYSNIESFGICYSNSQRLESRQKLFGSGLKVKRSLLGSMKILNFSFCDQLHTLSGFDELPVLERLIVTNCIGLVEVCESIEACVELVLIDLSYCSKLEKLPKANGMLKKVKTLLLDGCNLGESKIEILDVDSPEMLKANTIHINMKTMSSDILEAIPSNLKCIVISFPSSLVKLSLANNNLSTESFPMDFNSLSMLRELYIDGNPIVSLPSCVKRLPRLEILSIKDCPMLNSVEHPPHTLRELILHYDDKYYSEQLLGKVVFDPQMSPLLLRLGWDTLAPSSFEFEGMVKIHPLAGVDVNILHSLGWTDLECVYYRWMGTNFWLRGLEEYQIQMYYEFGIFSTIYGGKDMPNWIRCRGKGSSVSFTIPSSLNKFKGLNFCYLQTIYFLLDYESSDMPMILISNVTKNQTWMYQHYIDNVSVYEECLIFLSHWMFGLNEMEAGDHVTITISVTSQQHQLTEECGVSLVYDDKKTDEEEKEEEEDLLGYYKSWNHIIGGDLTGFQLTTGEYVLDNRRFLLHDNELYPYHQFVGDYASLRDGNFKEKVCFKALSPRNSVRHLLGRAHEDVTE
ncbi:disease resistance protein RUN1 [Lactuca sativa]|uniref:disease resistance protein RUN1 n=1 Tax=Lactuca sativa TaxID=4236 RepID=UPI001C68F170|nr:disease resistance protein RUN1 [Lactuca sativa]